LGDKTLISQFKCHEQCILSQLTQQHCRASLKKLAGVELGSPVTQADAMTTAPCRQPFFISFFLIFRLSFCQDSINPDVDTEIVIERLKSGDVPPGDFKFEDMRDPQTLLRQDALADNRCGLDAQIST
jgi:hypothetical protein